VLMLIVPRQFVRKGEPVVRDGMGPGPVGRPRYAAERQSLPG
jgi:hypothetical protein